MSKSDRSEMTKNSEIELLILENRRFQKIIDALIEHAETPVDSANSAFGLFQATVLLEDQVRFRTAELETALHKNELISQELQLSKEQIEKKRKNFKKHRRICAYRDEHY